MKKKLGILWLVAIILLSFNACDNGSTSNGYKDELQTPTDSTEPGGSTGSGSGNYKELLDVAVNLFEDSKIDEGIKQIEKAYENTKNDTTKMYYALARLACISTNTDTVKFMKETCGFERYPNKLNALIDTDCWKDCLKDGFVEKVAKANSKGLNNALNELLNIFTTTYNEVVEISKGMGQSTVTLPAKLIEALELEELFGDSDILAGKAELDVVIAAMGLVKGGLEYISAFDWTFDTSSIKTDMEVDDFITAVQTGTKLLTTTNKDRLAASKKSFIGAVNLAMSSYDYIVGENKVYPTEIKDTLNEYNIFYKAANAFKDALESGGTFYVPDADILELNEWPTRESSDWLLKINCGQLFSDGVLDSAVEKDSSGKVNFYTTCDWYYMYLSDEKYEWDESDDSDGTPLAEKFASVHEKNVSDVKTKMKKGIDTLENVSSPYWSCETGLAIKIRLPECIIIKDSDVKEMIVPIWSEYSNGYDYK